MFFVLCEIHLISVVVAVSVTDKHMKLGLMCSIYLCLNLIVVYIIEKACVSSAALHSAIGPFVAPQNRQQLSFSQNIFWISDNAVNNALLAILTLVVATHVAR